MRLISRVALILAMTASAAVLAEPVGLVCYLAAYGSEASHKLYIDIENREFQVWDNSLKRKRWMQLDNVEINSLSVSGDWSNHARTGIASQDIIYKWSVDRTSLNLHYSINIFGKVENLPVSRCEITDLQIDNKF